MLALFCGGRAVQPQRREEVESMDRIAEPWGERTPVGQGADWPERVDLQLEEGLSEQDVDRWVRSACVLCSHGCGLDIAVADGRIVGVRGRAEDRVNRGRLGPKGLFGWQANNAADRLTHPLVRRDGELVETDWQTALGTVAERSRQLLAEQGPLAIGFYTTGQLFLEEYYTLGVIGTAGIGTPHMDGNTRLCTATADQALKESFGSDGDPGSYLDINECDTLFLVGHNVAETQTVMWMRMLDRLHGLDRPKLVVVDPRPTPAALQADLHLPIRNGTNLALLNAVQHELIANDWVDHAFVDAHTVGFEQLRKVVSQYPAERAAEICGVAAEQIRQAARLIGTADRLVSTCLQGVYQSHQATASAVAINNVNLLRGMVGRPGCTVFQMNGQPTAQNTRECGANGDMPAFLNWQNPRHVDRLARHWNVDASVIPHWFRHTHAMQIFRYCEEGAIRLLWISGTNPAVSLPELPRIRSILAQDRLFVVVQDAFLTETARLADVVLPTALWGEKTGTFTNADRTVHLSEKAVDPPGEARSDLDIWLEFARLLDLRDADGELLLKWSTPQEAFDHFKRLTAGRPCDYSGMSYDRLRALGQIQWPCNAQHPDGGERLYEDRVFNTDPDTCEEYGHDLTTGAGNEESDYRALNPAGRAILKAAHYSPPHERPTDDYPLLLTTGRTVYHFHTRTKTARSRRLEEAAPDVWVEVSAEDAAGLGIGEGDLVRVESRRGSLLGRARVSSIRPGVVFVPFHYGYWDREGSGPDGDGRAANELTMTGWDPVSKQPYFKVAAVRLARVGAADGQRAPAPEVSAPAGSPAPEPPGGAEREGGEAG
jgi:ferredoxin-nitrate reductase